MSSEHVRPFGPPLTEFDAREILAKPLLAACSNHGPTRVGATINCHEKTVREARDEKSTLSLHTAANLLALEPTALDGFLEKAGRRSVPIGSKCDTDDRVCQSRVLQAALALSVALEDGEITPAEVATNRATIEHAIEALQGLLGKLSMRSVAR